jgi:hypothetical protein
VLLPSPAITEEAEETGGEEDEGGGFRDSSSLEPQVIKGDIIKSPNTDQQLGNRRS